MIFQFLTIFFLADQALSQTNGCIRTSYGRGVGTIMTPQCLSNEQVNGALCYPYCRSGFNPVGCCICRRTDCPQGFQSSADGASCIKPAPYGRGAGYPWKFGDPLNDSSMYRRCEADYGAGNCEKSGLIVYPKCRTNFHAVSCCVCSPDCPNDYTDIGAFCMKSTYGRGAGVSRLGCSSNKDQDAGLCYNKCSGNMNGVGPVCWGTCNAQFPFNCGAICTSNSNECTNFILGVVGDSAKLALGVVKGAVGIAARDASEIADAVNTAIEVSLALAEKFSLPSCH